MPEPSLHDIQQYLKSRIRPRGTASGATHARTLNAQRGTPGEERLSVYAGGYTARMREALAEVYEAVHHVLGERAFTELTDAYAARHQSHDYNLTFAGRHLSEFLPEWPRTARLPFLPDLARLEWRVCEAFHAYDEPPLDPTRLAGVPLEAWDRARLVFQPSVALIASAWPVQDLWEARKEPRVRIDIELVNRPQRIMVFRHPELQVRCAAVDERQYALLEGLLAGRTLGEVCGALAAQAGDEALPLSDWFAAWAANGLLRDIEDVSRSR